MQSLLGNILNKQYFSLSENQETLSQINRAEIALSMPSYMHELCQYKSNEMENSLTGTFPYRRKTFSSHSNEPHSDVQPGFSIKHDKTEWLLTPKVVFTRRLKKALSMLCNMIDVANCKPPTAPCISCSVVLCFLVNAISLLRYESCFCSSNFASIFSEYNSLPEIMIFYGIMVFPGASGTDKASRRDVYADRYPAHSS